jgi:hypothetical protein
MIVRRFDAVKRRLWFSSLHRTTCPLPGSRRSRNDRVKRTHMTGDIPRKTVSVYGCSSAVRLEPVPPLWIRLSATVGNPEALVDWLAGNCRQPPRGVFSPPAGAVAPAEVKLDDVGSVENAAMVSSRMHRGEKHHGVVDPGSRMVRGVVGRGPARCVAAHAQPKPYRLPEPCGA